jgi:transposase
MSIQEQIQIRKQKGLEIAKTGKVKLNGNKWIVPSQSLNKYYDVILKLDRSECNCPDYQERQIKCKHIFAVEITVSRSLNRDGSVTVTQTKRIIYPQDWSNYTKAQNEEGRLFRVLLKDLVANVDEPVQTFGRPRIPLKEALFCAIEKVYSMQSSRRAYSLYVDAQQKGQINKAPKYNIINVKLNDKELTSILYRLLEITAMPLRAVETEFAIDSTGFRTTKFGEYCHIKYASQKRHHFLKAHLSVGVKTNVVVSAEITDENSADSPHFIPLVNTIHNNGFQMVEVSADKGYLAKNNLDIVAEYGAIPYIPFKSNNQQHSKGSRVWNKMFHYYEMCRDEFMEHYHKRSNIETTNMAIKMKFGDCLKNKNLVSQTNELLCKLIAYNITVLINSMYELGIEPKFIVGE